MPPKPSKCLIFSWGNSHFPIFSKRKGSACANCAQKRAKCSVNAPERRTKRKAPEEQSPATKKAPEARAAKRLKPTPSPVPGVPEGDSCESHLHSAVTVMAIEIMRLRQVLDGIRRDGLALRGDLVGRNIVSPHRRA